MRRDLELDHRAESTVDLEEHRSLPVEDYLLELWNIFQSQLSITVIETDPQEMPDVPGVKTPGNGTEQLSLEPNAWKRNRR